METTILCQTPSKLSRSFSYLSSPSSTIIKMRKAAASPILWLNCPNTMMWMEASEYSLYSSLITSKINESVYFKGPAL